MASLRQIVRDYKEEILDGIAWVCIWKEKRSWYAEAFWPEDGDYDYGYFFNEDDTERMKEILKTDHKAICINGYYGGFGDTEDVSSYYNTIPAIEERVFWKYTNRYSQLDHFVEGFIIK